MALTRPGGYIQAAAPTVTFLNGKGYWTQNQISQYKTLRRWPQQFSTVLAIPQGTSLPLLYAWDGTSLAYNTYTAPGTNAYRGLVWDRAGRALFYGNSSTSAMNGYEFTKAGGAVSTYTGGTFSYVPQNGTLKASPTSDRLWFYSQDSYGRLCQVSYDPAAKTWGTVTTPYNQNSYPYSGDKRPSISPDGNFYGSGNSSASGNVPLFRINQTDGTSSGIITTPTGISSLAGATYNVAWSPSGAAIGIGMGSGTPRFRIYRWSADTYYGAEYSYTNWSSAALGGIYKVAWNNAGNVIFFLAGTAPYLVAYQWNDTTGLGSKFADPSGFTWSTGNTGEFQISPDDKLIVFNTQGVSGSEVALAWDNTTGFGAVTSMPVSVANSNSVAFGTLTT
jgi:hypothetical protein